MHKQFSELQQVQGAKLADGAVRRKVTCSERALGDVLVELSGDLAGTDGACNVGVNHDFGHHRRMKGLVARAIFGLSGVKVRKF